MRQYAITLCFLLAGVLAGLVVASLLRGTL